MWAKVNGEIKLHAYVTVRRNFWLDAYKPVYTYYATSLFIVYIPLEHEKNMNKQAYRNEKTGPHTNKPKTQTYRNICLQTHIVRTYTMLRQEGSER